MSEKTKWTPGPYDRSGQSIYALEDAGHRMKTNRFYAYVDRSGSEASKSELEAVAQLWVAAPALAEALHNSLALLKLFVSRDDDIARATLDQAEAALALARGETTK